MASKPTASGSLTLTLEVIREMLNLRNTYSQLDAENGNSSSALAVRHQANSVNHRSGNGERSSLKRYSLKRNGLRVSKKFFLMI